MKQHYHGSCQCGKIKLTAAVQSLEMGLCHCRSCRKMNAGPVFILDAGFGKDILFEGLEHITVYSSSERMERGFCSHCGTTVYSRLVQPDFYEIPVDIFDDLPESELIIGKEFFCSSQPEYYHFVEKGQRFERFPQ
ncbi:GFA family protein [Enterococcus sp. LJL128]